MKPLNQLCAVLLIVLCVTAVERGCDHGGARPSSGKADTALITYNVNKKPAFLSNQTLLDVLDAHPGKGHYRIVESTAQFGSDQPEFKTLMADPARTSPDWITTGTSTEVTASEALPANESETESFIKKHTK